MRSLCFIFAGLLLCSPIHGQSAGKAEKATGTSDDQYVKLAGNSIGMWLSNNGSMSHNPMTDGSGLEWPLGSEKYLIFEEGTLLGAMVNGEIRVGGSTYRYGLQAGSIRADGSASDYRDPRFRVYRLQLLTRSQYSALPMTAQQQLRRDFNEWPVGDGAPWVDTDGDGSYTPDFDAWLDGDGTHDHPEFPGREIAWYVSNDLNPSRAHGLFGTMPMGIEMQVFVWSGAGGDIAERTVYVRHTIINKSSKPLNDAYLTRWVDPDLGDASDDLVGVDTTLGMMFCYNDSPPDGVYGAAPPAIGHLWLQTPVVPSPADSARWGDGWRQGYRNLEPSAFAFYIGSSPVYQDPDLGVPEGARQMYNYMSGKLLDGSPYIDPLTGREVRMPLAGDPVTRNGWIDGVLHQSDDRRMQYSCGPFTFLPGDTQHVVMATIVGLGDSPLLALQDLRRGARMLLREHIDGVGMLEANDMRHSITWPQPDAFMLSVSATTLPGQEIAAVVRGPDGGELLRFSLFDDGQHEDGGADDGRYAGTIPHAALSTGGDLFLVAMDGGAIHSEVPVDPMLPLVGEMHISDVQVLSDHMDFNGMASPGENVIIGCALENRGTQALGAWILSIFPAGTPRIAVFPDRIEPGGNLVIDGMRADLSSALQFDVPAATPVGIAFRIPLLLMSAQYCLWRDTLVMSVSGPTRPMYAGLFRHTAGTACGTLGYTVADPSALGSGSVRITVEGDIFAEKTLTMRDQQGKVLRSGIPVPDEYGHHSPTVAGLRLRIGTTTAYIEMDPDGFPLTEPLQYAFEPPERAWFKPYAGYLIYGFDFFGSAILDIFSMPPVELIFDHRNPQRAYAYLRGSSPNYAYQGYFECPLTAWDVSDTHNPRQLGLAFIEQNGGTMHDNTWYPSTGASDREYLFILDDTYSETPHPAYMVPFLANAVNFPILYALWPVRLSNDHTFTDGDRFRITPRIPISRRDEYFLDLSLVGVEDAALPLPREVMLYPNHPNPFSASTSVIYRIGEAAHVELAVYDAFGRKLRSLVAGWKEAGSFVATFTPGEAPSGVYFCRLTAGGQTVTQRMVLLR